MGPLHGAEDGVDETRVIERGDGCYVWDHQGNRYLDGLAGLFVVPGRPRPPRARAGGGRPGRASSPTSRSGPTPTRPRSSSPTGSPRSPRATSTGCSSPPAAARRSSRRGSWPASTSGRRAAEPVQGHQPRPRLPRHHHRGAVHHRPGRHQGAVRAAAARRASRCANTNQYRCRFCASADACSHAVRRRHRGDDHRARAPRRWPRCFLEPVQNAGGCFVPPDGYFAEVRRDLRQVRRAARLRRGDLRLRPARRLVRLPSRLGYQPDMFTFAKGLTSGYSPLGAMIVSDRLAEPFVGHRRSFLHGITFGGHPVSCAVALANLDVMEREDLLGNVPTNEGAVPHGARRPAATCPIVGDVRGMGYFYGIELVKDQRRRGDLHRRGVRLPPPRLPVDPAARARPDLPGRRPGRARDPAVAAADRRSGSVRRDQPGPPPGAHRGHVRDVPSVASRRRARTVSTTPTRRSSGNCRSTAVCPTPSSPVASGCRRRPPANGSSG